MQLRWTIILIVLLALTACGPQPTASPAAQPSPTASVPGPAAEVTITLRQSGGVAGRDELFVIKPDGTVMAGTTTKQVEGGAAAAAELASRLRATGIYDVATGEYMPANPCCDRFKYTLTLVRDGKSYNYVTMDGSENAPQPLMKAIALIQEYLARAR